MDSIRVTGRPVGRPLNPPGAEEIITDLVYVGEELVVALDPDLKADLEAVGAIVELPS